VVSLLPAHVSELEWIKLVCSLAILYNWTAAPLVTLLFDSHWAEWLSGEWSNAVIVKVAICLSAVFLSSLLSAAIEPMHLLLRQHQDFPFSILTYIFNISSGNRIKHLIWNLSVYYCCCSHCQCWNCLTGKNWFIVILLSLLTDCGTWLLIRWHEQLCAITVRKILLTADEGDSVCNILIVLTTL